MKKLISILLCIIIATSFVACAGSRGNSTTLMIYMVGSDLEAKGGAGTADLEEMLKSEVDLSKNNVVVYAGGTKRSSPE